MITPRLRPRLDMQVALSPDELIERLRDRLREPAASCAGLVSEDHVELRIHERDRRFWSPQLVVRIRPEGEGCAITGHFGPDAHVWTLFLAMYAIVVLSAAFASFYGVAQLMIGESPHAFWSVPVAAVLVVCLYVAAGIGQRLGHDQVDVLLRFLDSTIAPGTEGPGGHDPRVPHDGSDSCPPVSEG